MIDFNAQANDLCLSDMHKDAYGYRPRINFNDGTWTQESFDTFVERTGAALRFEIEESKIRDAERKADFESRISGYCTDFGITRETAMRWDMDASDCDGDVDYYLYLQGMHRSDVPEFAAV